MSPSAEGGVEKARYLELIPVWSSVEIAEGALKGNAPLLPGSQDRGTPIFKRSTQAVPPSMPIGSQS